MWQSIEETSFFDEIEDIWDEIAHISRIRAHWTEMWAPGFIFRYQKSTLQCRKKSVSRRVWTLLVSFFWEVALMPSGKSQLRYPTKRLVSHFSKVMFINSTFGTGTVGDYIAHLTFFAQAKWEKSHELKINLTHQFQTVFYTTSRIILKLWFWG